ncbi:hypothetical protein PAHAL_7G196000 [Panicum hallii]|jgi:hypothetical protein|uniref:Uncharacterized protein n=1 Tax=Panicum hallii TaxID=206008 RepID=A0A2S3I7X0_9POAL|nr:hypothetical protein PAHAL_7G196000 [Panicum hallii]
MRTARGEPPPGNHAPTATAMGLRGLRGAAWRIRPARHDEARVRARTRRDAAATSYSVSVGGARGLIIRLAGEEMKSTSGGARRTRTRRPPPSMAAVPRRMFSRQRATWIGRGRRTHGREGNSRHRSEPHGDL